MTITLNGTTGITTPSLTSDAGITADGISFADGTPSNTLVTTTGGNVGIGTNTPQNGGSFSKVASIYNATNCALSIGNGNRHYQWGVGTSISDGIGLYDGTAGAYRMLIDSSGNLLINTTATSGLGGFRFGPGGTGCLWVSNATADGNTHASFQTATVQKGYIATSGGSTIYSTSSDYRLKENIQPMTGALNKVMQLKPVTYRWIEEQVDSQGFIAHELQEVVPQCVLGEKDAVDEEGKPVYQGIDTSFLVATLTAAIQELKAELDTVKTELATLKGTA